MSNSETVQFYLVLRRSTTGVIRVHGTRTTRGSLDSDQIAIPIDLEVDHSLFDEAPIPIHIQKGERTPVTGTVGLPKKQRTN